MTRQQLEATIDYVVFKNGKNTIDQRKREALIEAILEAATAQQVSDTTGRNFRRDLVRGEIRNRGKKRLAKLIQDNKHKLVKANPQKHTRTRSLPIEVAAVLGKKLQK